VRFCRVASDYRSNQFLVCCCIRQNPTDKREIVCDDKLKEIMGGNERVTMFNRNRYITPHLVEKLDRSAYVHDDAGDEEGDSE
jgi:hypothetical protein